MEAIQVCTQEASSFYDKQLHQMTSWYATHVTKEPHQRSNEG